MHRFSVIFCGTPAFACPSLQALHDDPSFDVTHVITQPDKPVGRKKEITPSPVKVLAEKLDIPVLQPTNINKAELPKDAPDFLVVVAYGQILSKEILGYPIVSPINVHASLLPRWRGAAPIHHALLEGDEETGVTIQVMDAKLDEGAILEQSVVLIDERETFATLHDKLKDVGASLLMETLKKPLEERQQDESNALFCTKLKRERGVIDVDVMTAEEVDRHVRALVPWPGVKLSSHVAPQRATSREALNGVKLIETQLEPHEDAFELECAKNSMLYITKIQSPGKGVVTGLEWGRGNPREYS